MATFPGISGSYCMQNHNVCSTGLSLNPTQMWNADIDYPYACTYTRNCERGARISSSIEFKNPLERVVGDGFSEVLCFCLGFAPKSDLREICELGLSLKNRSDRSLPILAINKSARNMEKSNIGNVGCRCVGRDFDRHLK